MRSAKSADRVKVAAAATLVVLAAMVGVPLQAQTNALAVNIQGNIFDRDEPPAPSVTVTDTVGSGLQVMMSPTPEAGFNLVLFTDNSGPSKLFKWFRYPGKTMDVNGVHIPENALVFYGNVQDGRMTGDLLIFSGFASTTDGLRGPQDILYAGSLDNPAIREAIDAPLYSWDYASDGLTGNGDNLACQPAMGPLPAAGYIAVIERGTCPFSVKASIPVVFVKRSDGLALVKHADDNRSAPATVEIYPVNLLGTINGTYQMNPDGTLGGLNLNLVIGTQWDYIFSGTISR